YLVRIGWSQGDQEIFSIEEMIKAFNLDHINASPSRFDFEKLKLLNKHYHKESKFDDIKTEVEYNLSKICLDISNGPD
ncbi:glutamate--tRNA ligase, partial [Francisella tularensis subsp. holarctica]|nr:glutamate--tRNA ligase [Francisella tularensis subsp. holarctica]